MDRHADTRDARRHKRRMGMAVKGRSLLTVQRTVQAKAAAAAREKRRP